MVVDKGTILRLYGGSMSKNRASFDGGAICTRENANVQAIGTTFKANEAKTGGAVFVDTQGVMSCDSVTFDDNHGSMFGGAVTMTLGSKMTTKRTVFTHNRANDEGGAIFMSDAILDAKETIFRFNAVKSRGASSKMKIFEKYFCNKNYCCHLYIRL